MYINMDMKYRDRNEIIAQILESANGDRVRLTKIMYDVYLGVTKEYVRLLIEKGLMEYLHCLTKLRIVVTVIVHYVFSLGL